MSVHSLNSVNVSCMYYSWCFFLKDFYRKTKKKTNRDEILIKRGGFTGKLEKKYKKRQELLIENNFTVKKKDNSQYDKKRQKYWLKKTFLSKTFLQKNTKDVDSKYFFYRKRQRK